MVKDSRIKIITGHFGSGKTEIAVNLSLKENSENQKVAIADLDVVNPYFRSRDVKNFLEEKKIELIAPIGQYATSDLPIVSGEIYRIFYDPAYRLIIDVGGDKDGAVALGQYYNDLNKLDYQMYFVVNINRPYVSDVNGIIKSIKEIESASRLEVSAIINNTHLGNFTELDNIKMGVDVATQVSKELNIPFLYTTISSDLIKKTERFSQSNNVLYIYRFMKLPWE